MRMFTEIEATLTTALRERIVELPKEHINVDFWPNKPPAVRISNLKFKIQNAAMAENMDMGKVEIDEKLDGDGVKTSFRLKEKPFKDSVRIESPPGILRVEKDDYVVEYADGAINFHKAAAKGSKILVRYCSQGSVMNLKSLKLKALYCFDVWGSDRCEADSLAEKILKALVTTEDQFLLEGVEMKPVSGAFLAEDSQMKIRLKFLLETEIRIEQIVGPMERIEIKSKNI
jgi:hypothetical protein